MFFLFSAQSLNNGVVVHLFKPTTSSNHHLPHGYHVANDSPPQQKNLIRTKS